MSEQKPTQTSKHELSGSGVDLHRIEELQRINVRSDTVLRPLCRQDTVRLLEVLDADPAIRERVTVAARMHSGKDVVREVQVMEIDPELMRYAITDESDKFIGLVSFWLDSGFFGQVPLPHTYGFGYFLDPHERGKGIVTDSIKQLMAVAANNIPNIEGFTAFCEDGNQESVAVLTKLGFETTDKLYIEPVHGWGERQYVRGLVK